MNREILFDIVIAIMFVLLFGLGFANGAMFELRRSIKTQDEIFRAWKLSEGKLLEILGIVEGSEKESPND